MKHLFHKFRALPFHKEDSGTSLVETALCFVITLTLVFGIINVSGAIYLDHFVVAAARQGARYASVRGSNYTGTSCATVTSASCAATTANVVAYVRSIGPIGIPPSDIIVTPTWPGVDASGYTCTNYVRSSNTFGCLVTVTVSYSFFFALPYLNHKPFLLHATSSQTISQ